MSQAIEQTRPTASLIGVALGACALLLVMTHFWVGPFAPQQNVAVSIGELAGEIRQAATRALTGAPQPEPQTAPWNIDDTLKLVGTLLAGSAVILGIIGFIRHETRRPITGALALGIGAILFQIATWTILMVIGVILLIGIMQNMGEILGDWI
ncbi:hypothetical protein F9L33_06135 [Amylibacter sp. SFDW26]|uniref:hypothetical protein n=1 Tax=Amylibacter sp. SFDW26 TaxID=2652722 RepID=UPI001262A94F|nr:hypothetical protein [Amylibacter sp. SFDW26]KAB7616325.1 hypothetical protein F9L33_06135 [Amylibacter sp. SFDW26]